MADSPFSILERRIRVIDVIGERRGFVDSFVEVRVMDTVSDWAKEFGVEVRRCDCVTKVLVEKGDEKVWERCFGEVSRGWHINVRFSRYKNYSTNTHVAKAIPLFLYEVNTE